MIFIDFNYIQSPLNYTGSKFKLLPQILPLFPKNINTFVDLFCGGCNVGINIDCKSIIYNDSNKPLIELYNTFKSLDKSVIFDWIYKIINKYQLSLTYEHGYEYYGCVSSKGLSSYNKEKFFKLRADFNEKKQKRNYDYYYYVMLYVIIVYAFNNQIRFNSNGEFNLPVGKRDFNKKMQQKLSDFIDRIKEQNCKFTCLDFREFNIEALENNDFVYVDPPYLNAIATYNEQNNWTEEYERLLLSMLDELNEKGIKFALSNNLKYGNSLLVDWMNNYNVHYLKANYNNCNYHKIDKSIDKEILVTNY